MSFTPQPNPTWPPPAPQPTPQPERFTPTWPPPAPRAPTTWATPQPAPQTPTWAAPQPAPQIPTGPVPQPAPQTPTGPAPLPPSQPSPPPTPQPAPAVPTWPAPQAWQANTHQPAATFTPDTHRILTPASKASPFAWVVLVAGLAALGASLLPYYTVVSTIDWQGVPHTESFTGNSWFGLYGWLAAVLLACSAGAAAMHIASAKTRRPFAVVAVFLSVAGLASAIAARVIYPDITNLDLVKDLQWFTVDKLYGYGYWVGLGCAIVATVAAVVALLGAMRKPTR